MIMEFFEDLKRVDGVQCIVLFDKNLKLIERWSAKYLSEKIFNEIRMDMAQVFSLTDKYSRESQEFVLVTTKDKIYSRNFDRFYLLVLAHLKVDIQLIRLIVTVGWGKMLKNKKIQKALRKLPEPSTNYFAEKFLDDVEAKYLNQLNHIKEE